VAPYKRLRDVRFAAALPRSPAGKLLRRHLVESDGKRGVAARAVAPSLIRL
jgi:acyl-coenzyme A synthetase/AMP-(fatty) acid ligase